jgi:hypothetical protein
MARIHPGRYTARLDGDFVVFVIGMRLNKLWKVHRWWPVFVAMPRMLNQLNRHPELGLLGTRFTRSGRTITSIQYWRSFDLLERFAKDPDLPHLAAWRSFTRKVGASGDVGVFHETFQVPAGSYECIYSNMPVFGLAAAGEHVTVGRGTEAARERISAGA